MDNPWASPWATNEPDDTSGANNNLATANPEPPPPAFFSSTPNNLSVPSGHSAWEDDNSFGDWASPEPATASTSSGSATWGIWGSTESTTGDGQLTPRFESRRKGSNPQWPSSRSTSPGLRPPPLSKRSSSDHLSNDPWASEPSFNEAEAHTLPRPSQLKGSDDDWTPQALRTRPSTISINIEPQSPPPTVAETPIESQQAGEPANELPSLQLDTAVSPSTSLSDNEAYTGVAHDDSPITPAEDASGSPDAAKKASKVQELVSMYDGITRKTSFTPELVPGPKRSASREPPSREATPDPQAAAASPVLMADEGDPNAHKTCNSLPEDDPPSANDSLSTDNSVSSNSHERNATDAFAKDPEESTNPSAGTQGDDVQAVGAPANISHEPFQVDLMKMDELFSGPKSHVTGEDVTVPDNIINDSFESISERKAWYRITRFGPMRKHNTGDDDNYVRISWASSSIRPEVIQTVRRWMEEDSMGGRLFRGGGFSSKGAGGTAFGWNQPSTPVSLEDFFKRARSGQATPDANARQSFSGPPAPSNSTQGEQRPLSMPVVPQAGSDPAWNGSAAFSWASSTPSSSIAGPKPPTQAPIPLQNPPRESNAPPALPLTKPAMAEIEDDEEWGEMVTPSVQEFPPKLDAPPDRTGRTPSESHVRFQEGGLLPSPAFGAKRVAFAEPAQDTPSLALEVEVNIPSQDQLSSQQRPFYDLEESATLGEPASKGPATEKVSLQDLDASFGPGSSPVAAPKDAGLSQQIIEGLPDLSYMLR